MPIIIDPPGLASLRRKRRPKKMAPVKIPPTSEREMRKLIDSLWAKHLEPIKRRIEEMVRNGVNQLEIDRYIQSVFHEMQTQYGIDSKLISERWSERVNMSTRTAIEKGLSSTLGVDIKAVLDTPPIAQAMARGAAEASGLIVTIPEQYLGDVSDAVMRNWRGEGQPEDRSLLEQIQHVGDVSFKRAKLIARDQTNKLTSTLNSVRQQSIGVDEYFWMTVKDQRVVGTPGGKYPDARGAHGNHYKMQGMLCRWSDPSVYSPDNGKTWLKRSGDMPQNNVGQDIQCRCFPKPKIDIQKILQHVEGNR